MFIATTQTPKDETPQDQVNEDFTVLLGRTCEYVKELEDMGRVKNGTFLELYEKLHSNAQSIVTENWIK